MRLNPKQTDAVQAKGDVVIKAGAGTGKTAVLSGRYHYLISEFGLSPLEIVAVTFTERAASELRHRIRQLIFDSRHQLEATGRDVAGILAELEASPIGTIHSLCARICREHPEPAQVAPDFTILDELEASLWLEEHLEPIINLIDAAVFELVPYNKIRTLLREMLANPFATEQALQIDPATVLADKKQILDELLNNIFHDPDWINSKNLLTRLSGPVDDKLEDIRKNVLSAINALEKDGFQPDYVKAFKEIDLRVGSRKKWGEDFGLVKKALGWMREQVTEIGAALFHEINNKDDELQQLLPSLNQIFDASRRLLAQAKWEERVLDFNDLEVQALAALGHKAVADYYHRRYRALLVDEFQDVSPIQGEILERLVSPAAKVLIVGDPKQSIYRFRRADLRVFARFKRFLIGRGGQVFVLDQSYRMRKGVVGLLNRVSRPLLREIHQELVSERLPDAEPRCLHAFSVDLAVEDKPALADLRICEGKMLADLIREITSAREGEGRIGGTFQSFREEELDGVKTAIRKDLDYSQIAVLARTHDILDQYLEILGEYDIPAVHAGGGNLLETRVFLDIYALLGFIADNADNLSLAALLRSPFFACSDNVLAGIAEKSLPGQTWWDCIRDSDIAGLERAQTVLEELNRQRYHHRPSQLCMLADELTAYSAVLANLPNAAQRLADWDGCQDLLCKLEQGNEDAFAVVRKIKLLEDMQAEWERPILEGFNAVNMLTVHAAKGLEWNVVFLVDLCHREQQDKAAFYADEKYGVAVKFSNADEDEQASFSQQIIKLNNQALNDAEDCRVHYVALTRARDLLVLTTPKPSGGRLDRLLPGLGQAEICFAPQPFTPQDLAVGKRSPEPLPPTPSLSIPQPLKLHLNRMGATDLDVYALCPRRFRYQKVDCHPGYFPVAAGNDPACQRRIGTLTHRALEADISDLKALQACDPTLPPEYTAEALELTNRFRNDSIYADLRGKAAEREKPIQHAVCLQDEAGHERQIVISGRIDLMGEDFVLDYKTDQVIAPEHHKLQMWVYQQASCREKVYIAYLRATEEKEKLVCFDKARLMDAEEQALGYLRGIMANDFPAHPSRQVCSYCPYGTAVCPDSLSYAGNLTRFADFEDDLQITDPEI